MKQSILSVLAIIAIFAGTSAFAKKAACHFADAGKLKEHLEKHVTYPAAGKDIKAACMKEMPEEFTKEEHSCLNAKLKDDTKYNDATQVMKALGV